ncbi:MAG: tRNA epoxyqueuosine(34) reductase QueG [Zoogloeaceae bacterium]|jgi:epoxyqueuosine reductase|nr:tRNA epoxyqueuosine(34) reductase QueG [Zoogloeaceae bacterium]
MQHADSSSLERLAALRNWALELGFSGIGVSSAKIDPATAARFRAWLARGEHGEMDYMARHAELRVQPAALLPGVRTVISAALDYWPETGVAPALECLADSGRAYVSRYALGRDYHKIVRQRLARLAARMRAEFGPFLCRAFADSAPVLETEFASKGGLGWRGKHGLLLSRGGSLRFLGELYTDLPLPPALVPDAGHCGTCRACLDVCPTGAIVAPWVLDARRCISYLTIELAGPIPESLRPLIGNRIYGCDDCQLACPWNRFARLGDPAFVDRAGLGKATLLELFSWNPVDFDLRLAGSPIRRIGFERWQRNLAVALGNHVPGQPEPVRKRILTALRQKRAHVSPLVREHIDGALRRAAVPRTAGFPAPSSFPA